MPKSLDPALRKIHKSCTLSPELVAAIEKYRHDPEHAMITAQGFHEAPTFNDVLEICTRIHLNVKPSRQWPKSPDETKWKWDEEKKEEAKPSE